MVASSTAIKPGAVGRENVNSRLKRQADFMTLGENENDVGGSSPRALEPDAHGQAALMLSESILHALMEQGTFTPKQARSVVSTAQEIKVEFANLAGESRGRMQASLDLLSMIAASLEHEIG